MISRKIFFFILLMGSLIPLNIDVASADSVPLSAFGQANSCIWPSSNNYGALLNAGSTSSITQIRIQYQSSTLLSDFNQNTIRIYSDVATAPGTLLGTLTPSTLGNSEYLFGSSVQTKTGTYTGNVSVTGGSKFWLVMNTSGNSITACQTTAMVTQTGGWSHVMNGSSYQFRINSSNFTYATIFTYEITIGSTSDTTPPTFNSSASFTTPENVSTSVNVATIQVSESATISISSGADVSLFNIIKSDSVTAQVRFKTSPNYEAPADVGANNVYDLTLTATDSAGNSAIQSITITVTDVLDTSSFNSLTVSSPVVFRSNSSISANVTVASRVTFKAGNVIISGCKNILATGSGSSFSVTCSWKPSFRGSIVISATSTPTNVAISGASANPQNVSVLSRTAVR